MKKQIIFFIISLICTSLFSQYKNDYIWALGAPAQNPSDSAGMNIVFSENGISIQKVKRKIVINLNNATGNDSKGNLVFYANGCNIYNQYDTLMTNGTGLNTGSIIHQQWCDKYNYLPSSFQANMVIPFGDSLFYLLHQRENTTWNKLQVEDILYTKIKYNKIVQKYEVISKNDTLLSDLLDSQHFVAVKHTNNKDWWIVQPKREDNEYYILQLGKDGLKEVKTQVIGKKPFDISQGGGAATFSPDGKKYIRYDPHEKCYIFDFDRTKGELSNFIFLPVDSLENPSIWGIGSCLVEPNNRFLYVGVEKNLYQYDLHAKDINSTHTTISEWSKEDKINTSYMILAPDCKIYITLDATKNYMHIVENPTLQGKACNFNARGLKLPYYNVSGALPYFPNYRLGTPYENKCKTNVATKDNENLLITANLYPNPAASDINLDLFGYINQYKKGIFNLYDTQGNLAITYPLLQNQDEYRFDISNLANGMYFWHLVLDDKIRQTGKVVVMNE